MRSFSEILIKGTKIKGLSWHFVLLTAVFEILPDQFPQEPKVKKEQSVIAFESLSDLKTKISNFDQRIEIVFPLRLLYELIM